MPIDTELEPAELEGRVLEAIEMIRPALQSDGGDIVFDRLDDEGVVHVDLVGACGTCPISMQTLKAGVERIIMDRAPGVTAVVDDNARRRRTLRLTPTPWALRPRRCSTPRAPATGALWRACCRSSRRAATTPASRSPHCR